MGDFFSSVLSLFLFLFSEVKHLGSSSRNELIDVFDRPLDIQS
jgi:hypothetical protein